MTQRILRLACADYPRIMPLATGQVTPEGFDLALTMGRDGSWPMRADLLRRVLAGDEFDGGESSLGAHVRRVAAGDDRFVALPIFVLRNFVARDLYVRKDGAVRAPADLAGKRVGIYSWGASGAVWYRHFMRHMHVALDAVEWWVGDVESVGETSPGGVLPDGVKAVPQGRFLAEMLAKGDVDALWSPLRTKLFDATRGPVTRLYPDFRSADAGYYAESGIYPPMHVVVLKRAVLESDPRIAPALVDVFNRATASFDASQRGYPYATPWMEAEVDATAALLGTDYHSNGLAKNRAALDVFIDQAFAAGLLDRRPTVDECFVSVD